LPPDQDPPEDFTIFILKYKRSLFKGYVHCATGILEVKNTTVIDILLAFEQKNSLKENKTYSFPIRRA
jgi:hypothetical protein